MKTGLIVEGGGMKCVYSTAILDKLLDDNISFDYGIGVSAGAANLITFIAKQRNRASRFYTVYPKRPEYMSVRTMLKRGEFLNLEYIYGTLSVADGEDPLDYEAMRNNPMEFNAVATDAETGKPFYMDKSFVHQDDYRVLMATSGLPVVSKGKVIDGHKLYDGGITDPLPVQRALNEGCDKLMIILAKPRDYIKGPQGMKPAYHAALRKYPKLVEAIDNRHLIHRKEKELALELEAQGKAFIIAPKEDPKMGTLRFTLEQTKELYRVAERDYEGTKEKWEAFLARK